MAGSSKRIEVFDPNAPFKGERGGTDPAQSNKNRPHGMGRAANPVQTTGFFGVEKGFSGYSIDAGNPLCSWRGLRGRVIS